jgi:hypothetical protein
MAGFGSANAMFLVRAWLLAPAVEVSLGSLGLDRTLLWLDALCGGRGARHVVAGGRVGVRAGEGLVRRAYRAHPLLGGLCLSRSLVQYALHRYDRTPARLVIGVRRAPDLDAHAWIEEGSAPAPAHAAGFARLLVREIGGAEGSAS